MGSGSSSSRRDRPSIVTTQEEFKLQSKAILFSHGVLVNGKATLATLKPKGLTVALWQRMPE